MTPGVMEQVLYMVDTSRGFSPMLAGILIIELDPAELHAEIEKET